MAGVVSPQGMPSYVEFVQGVTSALDHIRQQHEGHVLLVSSGGPIATAVAYVLHTSPETSIELNMRLRNSAVSEFNFNPKRHSLVSFNNVPHLETPSHKDWITFA
jgi:broad specificity phosphatase PhoE